jgi:hypothetical protein
MLGCESSRNSACDFMQFSINPQSKGCHTDRGGRVMDPPCCSAQCTTSTSFATKTSQCPSNHAEKKLLIVRLQRPYVPLPGRRLLCFFFPPKSTLSSTDSDHRKGRWYLGGLHARTPRHGIAAGLRTDDDDDDSGRFEVARHRDLGVSHTRPRVHFETAHRAPYPRV